MSTQPGQQMPEAPKLNRGISEILAEMGSHE